MQATISKVPGKSWGDLPEWGEPILRLLNERIFMTHQQIASFFPIHGKNKTRRRLIKLADMNYLQKYEIDIGEAKPITGYTVGKEGFWITGKIMPEICASKALEFTIANEFFVKNGILDPVLWISRGLIIGEIMLGDQKFALWCPREDSSKINSLKAEVELSCRGLIVVSPSLKLISQIADKIDLYVPIYFTTDTNLTEFMQYKNGSIQPI